MGNGVQRGAARYYGAIGAASLPLGSVTVGEGVCLFRLKPRQSPLESPTIHGGWLGELPLGAGRKVASCAACARPARPMGRWRQVMRLRKPPHEKFARSPCHHTAVSAPIAPASVRGAMGVFLHWLTYSSLFLSRPFGGQPTDYLTI